MTARVEEIKKILPSEDILTYEFVSLTGKRFAVVYADGIVDKTMIGELVIKPLSVT